MMIDRWQEQQLNRNCQNDMQTYLQRAELNYINGMEAIDMKKIFFEPPSMIGHNGNHIGRNSSYYKAVMEMPEMPGIAFSGWKAPAGKGGNNPCLNK